MKASVLHGPEKFVMAMLQEINGDRREQRGIWERERFGLRMAENYPGNRDVMERTLGSDLRRTGNGALGLADYLCQRHAGITLRELGRYVGEVEYPAVSLAVARFEKRLKSDRSLEKRLKQVITLLNVEM